MNTSPLAIIPQKRQQFETQMLIHNADSKIMFDVQERSLWFYNNAQQRDHVPEFKLLVHIKDEDETPITVVRSTYKLVKNEELFSAIEALFPDDIVAEVEVRDAVAYNGKFCMREYTFPSIRKLTPEGRSLIFRVVVINGYGDNAIQIHAGAIDMFCTNGCIIGSFMSKYARHTSGVSIKNVTSIVTRAHEAFITYADTIKVYASIRVEFEQVWDWLEKHFSLVKARALIEQFKAESKCRAGGMTLWALHCALTNYATYDNIITLRRTKADHKAQTMFGRELEVMKVINDKHHGFKALGYNNNGVAINA